MQRMITPQYEQIVNEIEHIYHHPDTGCSPYNLFKLIFSILPGLLTIAQWLGVSILPPNKKISILLIGNHSAGKSIRCGWSRKENLFFLSKGKSSLVNWYIEDSVQRTGVAIETQGQSFRIKF